jgi:Tol biopolymer transport system component
MSGPVLSIEPQERPIGSGRRGSRGRRGMTLTFEQPKAGRLQWIASGLFAVAAVSVLLWPAAAEAQFYGQNKVQYRNFDFRVISSPHFDIYYYQGGDSLALRVLDLAEKTNIYLTGKMGHVLTKKIPIILYNSANDFRQTNVITEIIGEGTGGFTELLRNRVVIPYTGSYGDLRHVVVHELVHAFMFDLLYGGGLGTFVSGGALLNVPLWFAEGYAEWLSQGWSTEAEMFVRDGVITGYLPPLPYSGGFLVYKQGQAAMMFIEERYGEERFRELLQKMKMYRNFDRAFQSVMGTSVAEFDEDFDTWLRRQHWPEVSEKSNPDIFARRLTDHRRDRSNLNMGAAVSPTGDRVAYFSDRSFYTEILVMSALDGKTLDRVVKGQRNVSFESLPSFRSSMSWSPDGKFLVFVAGSQSRDVLYISDVDRGKVVRKIKNDFDALMYPAWHPSKDLIAVVGVKDGRSDLYLIDAEGNFERLTNDKWDEKEPKWHPDGTSLVFASDRANPVVLIAAPVPEGFGNYGIYDMDVTSRRITRVVDTWGNDGQPTWSPDGERLLFISDRGGANDAYLYDVEDSTFVQLTELQGGLYSLSWSRDNDRVVFTAFTEGGWDVFAAKQPLSLDAVIDRLIAEHPQSVFSWDEMQRPLVDPELPDQGGLGALAPAWPDTVLAPPPDLALPARSLLDTLQYPELEMSQRSSMYYAGAPGDTILPVGLVSVIDTAMVEEPYALPDSLLSQKPHGYRPQFSVEFAGGGLSYNSAFGLTGSTALQISDFLGHHRFYIATDIFSGALDETNVLASYNYLPRRTDYGLAVFHFKNFMFSRVSSLGEKFVSTFHFTERNYGFIGSLSYPLSRFRRFDIDFQQVFVDRTFYELVGPNILVEGGKESRMVSAPSLSMTKDNVLYGYYGPIDGNRFFVSVTPTLPVTNASLQYLSVFADYRKYFNLGAGYQFVFRGVAGVSEGEDPQVWEIGGYNTLRGYDNLSLVGNRIGFMNLELRFPFINALGVVGPLPLGFFNLRGAAFVDQGVVTLETDPVQFFDRDINGRFRSKHLKTSFGFGVRSVLAFIIMKLDVAWRTDFRTTSQPIWHFTLGPEF